MSIRLECKFMVKKIIRIIFGESKQQQITGKLRNIVQYIDRVDRKKNNQPIEKTSTRSGKFFLKNQLIRITKLINPLKRSVRDEGEDFQLNNRLSGESIDDDYRKFLVLEKQSIINYIECLPYFWQFFLSKSLQRHNNYSLLDVGARSGVGANLYGLIFADSTWGYGVKINVDVTEKDLRWNPIGHSRPYINKWMNEDVFNIPNNSYDFCFCSHVIEHVNDPIGFAKKITNISKHFSMFYCPYNEKNPNPWHHVINEDIIAKINPVFVQYIRSANRRYNDLDFVFFICEEK